MSRKNKEWLKGIQHMAIAKRITLLYGGIFSLSLLFISGFMMLNISGLQQSEMRRELQETMTQVQAFTAAKQMKPTTILWERCRRFCFVPKGSLRAGKSRRTARTSRL